MANSLVAFQQGHIFTNNWYSGFNPSSEWFPAANPNVWAKNMPSNNETMTIGDVTKAPVMSAEIWGDVKQAIMSAGVTKIVH